jgi:hypothetical protein
MWTSILSAIFGFFRGWLKDIRAEQSLKDIGAAEASQKTAPVIEGMHDDQIRNDAVDRGGADAVRQRLHDKLDKGGGSAAAPGSNNPGTVGKGVSKASK